MQPERRLLIGGTALVVGKLKGDGPAMVEVCDELEPLLTASGFFENAPFKYVSLIIRYGLVNNTKPEYRPVIKKYGELPIAIELDISSLKSADSHRLKQIFSLATVEALIDVGSKYQLPVVDLLRKKEELTATGLSLN